MGITERRIRERQRRIEEIIDSAKHIFLAKGFTGTTMNDIADHSELSRRTLYHYFRSKEEVSLAAAAKTLDQLIDQLDIAHRAEESGLGRLELTLEIYRRMYVSDPGGFQFIVNFSESIRAMGRENEQVKLCLAKIDRIVEMIGFFISEGIEDKSIRPLANPARTAAVLVSIVHGSLQNAVNDRDVVRIAINDSPEDFLNEIFSILSTYLSTFS